MSHFTERKFDLCPPHYNQPLYSVPPYHDRAYPPPREVFYPTENFYDGRQDKDYEWGIIMLLGAIGSLCMVFIITVTVYYVYFRLYANGLRQLEGRPLRRAWISQARRFSAPSAEDYSLTSARDGLRRSMVDALPVFVYKPESFQDGLRCAVCLCEFQESEKGRMLPSCNHSFHVDCIDLWFNFHSTCPLCRASVEAQSEQSVLELGHRQMEVSVVEEEGADEKSGSAATDQHDECLNLNNDERKEGEEGSGADVAIDIPTSEK